MADFDAAFRDLTGMAPLRWQRRLYAMIVDGDIPSALDLPTGIGKTSVMAIWAIAYENAPEKLPRRLFYIVDRRTVVDQATAEAVRIAEAARRFSGRISSLTISTLRGQHIDNRKWLEDPSAPAIVIGTVDMIGSRLLFGGYGVSSKERPFVAGLMGADALFVLDEAHLCAPFEALLTSVAGNESMRPTPRRRPEVPRFHLMTLSATSRTLEGGAFSLVSDDAEDEIVRRRLGARKLLSFVDLPNGKKLSDVIAAQAIDLATKNGRIGVFVHRRADAVAIAKKLGGGVKKGSPAPLMIVGSRRMKERGAVFDDLRDRGFFAGARPSQSPDFVIATAAGEVGADLDFDHIVCDLVALERMIQRLGRLNRRGVDCHGDVRIAKAVVVVPMSYKDGIAKPLPGGLEATRTVLATLPAGAGDGLFDASPGALREMVGGTSGELLRAAYTSPPNHPAFTRALIDAWAMTSLPTHTGRPDIGPWLRGWVPDEGPETTVIWRRWLPIREDGGPPDGANIEEFFREAQPHLLEMLGTKTSHLVDTLCDVAKMSSFGDADIVGILLDHSMRFVDVVSAGDLRRAVEKGKFGTNWRNKLAERLSWRIVVVASTFGGLNENGLLDAIASSVSSVDAGWAEDDVDIVGVRSFGPDDKVPSDWRIVHQFPLAETEDGAASRSIRVAVARRSGDGSQSGNSAVQSRPQRLPDHSEAVVAEARRLVEKMSLSPEMGSALLAAAKYHDSGKARPLWQRAMRAPLTGGPYAKTTGRGAPAQLMLSGGTYRHEFGSLRDAEAAPDIQALPDAARDIALHLIAAHHGNARPTLHFADPDTGQRADKERSATAAVVRFARLQREWGPWGLAWLETLLRAADRRASAALNKGRGA